MALNTDLLKQTLAYILDNPEKWNQKSWATAVSPEGAGTKEVPVGTCGTAFCFAGTALAVKYPKAVMVNPYEVGGGKIVFDTIRIPRLGTLDISETAQKQLGLNDAQASDLFDASNKLPTILRMVAALLENPNVDLENYRR